MCMCLQYLMFVCQPSLHATKQPVKVSNFHHLILPSTLEIAADSLRGRVFEISLADLQNKANSDAWRKIKVQVEEVKNYDCYTNFYGMDVTRDKYASLVKKWHTVIEAFVQAKTTDGYMLRMFAIGFTKRTGKQVKATCYAKGSQRKQIRKKMMEIMVNEVQKSTLKELTKKFIQESIGK